MQEIKLMYVGYLKGHIKSKYAQKRDWVRGWFKKCMRAYKGRGSYQRAWVRLFSAKKMCCLPLYKKTPTILPNILLSSKVLKLII